ncbi:hypothetical protein ACS0TY_030263 [Phlomoides rotata]
MVSIGMPDVSFNNLSGPVPILHRVLQMSFNKLSGSISWIDVGENRLTGNILPWLGDTTRTNFLESIEKYSSLTGNLIPGIGEMERLETLDLSRNQLSGNIPIGLAQLNYLAVVDLANNNLSGEIPESTQLRGFNASVYAGNDGLCISSRTDQEDDMHVRNGAGLTSTQEFCITLALGFIVGFWGVVATLVVKTSWRNAYFNFFDAVGNWLASILHPWQ